MALAKIIRIDGNVVHVHKFDDDISEPVGAAGILVKNADYLPRLQRWCNEGQLLDIYIEDGTEDLVFEEVWLSSEEEAIVNRVVASIFDRLDAFPGLDESITTGYESRP